MRDEPVVSGSKRGRLRLALVVIVLVVLYVVGKATGLAEWLDVEGIRALVQDAGAWGLLLYTAVFALGELLHVPGMVFVAAGILVYGKLLGFIVAFFASLVSVTFSFLVVRRLGGEPFTMAQSPWLQRSLAHLDERPIRTVFLLRSVLWLAPVLNYALALTSVRLPAYIIGSALGLLLPVAGATLLIDGLVALL